jgi:hypothetical protein
MKLLILVFMVSVAVSLGGCGTDPDTGSPSSDGGSKGVVVNGQVELQPDDLASSSDGGSGSTGKASDAGCSEFRCHFIGFTDLVCNLNCSVGGP